MAENQDGQEKSEQPTPKKLSDAKKKGQIARSKELNTMAITLLGGIMIVSMLGQFGQGFADILTMNFSLERGDIFDTRAMVRHLGESIKQAVLLLAPFFIVVIVTAVISSVALGGLTFSVNSLAPKLNKFNPLKGFKRMFSVKALMELGKALAKFFLVGGAAVWLIWQNLDTLMGLGRQDLHSAVSEMGSLLGWSFVMISSTLILVAAVDVPFQIWDHNKQLKMTRQEVKDEMKDTEGRPEVKGRIRSLQRELAFRRMMEEVPKADVIVTNPTHYAVALRYEQQTMLAPKLVAKGVDLIAANIKKVGGENEVPIVESPALARAIYFHTELGESIPAGLYLAVAKLLAYIFQLQTYRTDGGERPDLPEEFEIPPNLRVPETGDD